jgi:hypothetical protein
MNLSIIKTYEINQWHSNPDAVLSVFQNNSKWVLYRESTEVVSFFSVLCDTLIWLPIAFMFIPGSIIFGAVVLILLLLSMVFSLPASVMQALVSLPAFAIGYVLSLLWVLKTQTPMKDFRERKKHLSSKEIFFDFANGVLVMGEVFKHFPANNKEIRVNLKKVELYIDPYYSSYGVDDHSDGVSLKIRSAHFPKNNWASHMMETYALCSINFDRRHDGVEKEVSRTLENIMAAFKQRLVI